jgi:SRSO17 transposase
LWTTGQAGELPGRGQPVIGHTRGEPADRLPTYLPKEWAADTARRSKAGVPNDVVFKTKPGIALEQIAQALADGVPPAVVLADAGYGNDSAWRAGLGELGLTYVVGIQGSTTVWRPGEAPLPPPPWSGRGRPPKRVRRDAEHQPVSVAARKHKRPDAQSRVVFDAD